MLQGEYEKPIDFLWVAETAAINRQKKGFLWP